MSNQNQSGADYAGDIDPEIAALMGLEEEPQNQKPGFADLFEEEAPEQKNTTTGPEEVDLNRERFEPISRYEAPKPYPYFTDKDYYKKLLNGEGETAQRVHKHLSSFLNAKDPKDKSLFRGKLISAVWNLEEQIAAKITRGIPLPKKLLLRYGILAPTVISAEQRKMLCTIIQNNDTGEPIHYVEEWLTKIATGTVSASMTDETKGKKRGNNKDHQLFNQMEKIRGQKEILVSKIQTKLSEIEAQEQTMLEGVSAIRQKSERPGFPDLRDSYSANQKSSLGEIANSARTLSTMDKELIRLYSELDSTDDHLNQLEEKAEIGGEGGSARVDNSALQEEFNTVRQMAKLCVGRQGNHIPFLMKQYFRPNIRDIGTRENVIMAMAEVEQLDQGLFKRTFKQQTNRIVPHTILIPCYGNRGVCWEPFERFNRATSRGRIAIPMFPQELQTAVLAALADLRWQVAKEKAQHYWMEEGLTGRYYQVFSDKKLRGDVKEYFIQDYILWITKESEGTQKLDRDIRGVFWRYVPFPQELKDSLRNRGYVYNELYKKDLNRSASDGY